MAYIGNDPSNRFVAPKAASVFSGDGSTTAFTLDHAVGSDEDILVSVDGVIQEPSVAYAVSNGTTLTFTGAPSSNSGNNIFVYYLFRTVGTVSHPSNNALQASDITVDTTTLVTDSTNNRVGIGTASPSTSLNVVGGEYLQTQDSADTVLTLTSTSNSGRSYQIRSQNSSGEFYVYDNTAGASRITVDSNGHVTMPSQSAFSANLGGTNSSTLATDGSALTLSFNTERFDTNADFASNTFTAPVTGKYLLAVQLRINNMDTATNYYIPTILTSNQAYRTLINPKFSSDISYIGMTTTIVADMDASDTATVTIQQSGGSAQSVVEGTADYTYFSGYLLG